MYVHTYDSVAGSLSQYRNPSRKGSPPNDTHFEICTSLVGRDGCEHQSDQSQRAKTISGVVGDHSFHPGREELTVDDELPNREKANN